MATQKRSIGLSKTPPKSEAKPLGTPTKKALRVTGAVHDWHKTNLVTISRGSRTFDTMKCTACGATGKRFGLSESVTPDQAKHVWCTGLAKQEVVQTPVSEKIVDATQKDVDTSATLVVDLQQVERNESIAIMPVANPATEEGAGRTMILTFKTLSKSGKFALYSGLRTVSRLSVTDFPDSTPPATLEITGNLAGPREAKPKMTAEERKAYRASHPTPKLTLAERVARAKAKLAKDEAKLAKENASVLQPA